MVRLPHTSDQAAILFRILLRSPGTWRHGYTLMQDTGLQSGSLYPLLIRLADDELLETEWQADDPASRPRRAYRLTPAGRSLARERVARFEARHAARAKSQGAGA